MLERPKPSQRIVAKAENEIEHQIAGTHRQSDDLLHQLYDITQEERKIIEAKM